MARANAEAIPEAEAMAMAAVEATVKQGAAPGRPARIGPWMGLFAYAGMLAAFLALGYWSQNRSIFAGLWLTEAVAIALPALLVLRLTGTRIAPFLGLGRPSLGMLALGLCLGLLNQPVISLLEAAAMWALPARWVADFAAKNAFLESIFRQGALPMMLAVTLAAPLGEETFFRGLLFPALASRWRPLWAAVLSGALFSAIHLDPVGYLGLWEIGFLLAVLRYRAGSLWPVILLHAVNNGAAGTAFLLGWQDPAATPPGWFLALGGALLAVGGWWTMRVLARPSPAPAREEPLAEPVQPLWLRVAPLVAAAGLLLAVFVALTGRR